MTVKHMQIDMPPTLHSFVKLVLGNPALQSQLASIPEVDRFVAEAVSVAAQHCILLDKAALIRFLRPAPPGTGTHTPALIEMETWPPTGWIPAFSVPTANAPAFDWLWVGSRTLTQPFFEDEIRTARAMPFNWLFRIRTGMDAIIAGSHSETQLPLHGLIFHMSRCGSTLLAQMLTADPSNAVCSEPEPLDAVIQWARLTANADDAAILAIWAMAAALGRDRNNGAKRHIIKLDAWHTHALPLLRTAFPRVNWVYIFRNPTEVLVSTMQQPGLHTVPGLLPSDITGFTYGPDMRREAYAARVLAGIGEAVVTHWGRGGGMVVAYPDLRDSAAGRIAEHFALPCDGKVRAAMAEVAKRDAKAPRESFSPDSVRKQLRATPAIMTAADHWMQPVDEKLKQLSQQVGEARPPNL